MNRRRAILVATVLGRGGSVEIPWYLPTGIIAAQVRGAYQAIGADSLADSYINLVNPGTNNLTAGATPPTWSAATGWNMTNVANQYLDTGLAPLANSTGMIRFSDGNAAGGVAYIFGSFDGSRRFIIRFDQVYYYYGDNFWQRTPAHLGGTLGLVNDQGYRDGVADGEAGGTTYTGTSTMSIYIGRCQGIAGNSCFANIQAAVFFNTTLTGAQMLELHTSMLALP